MAKLLILLKKKGSKRSLGAIPAKKGATRSKLQPLLRRLRKGFSARIITQDQLKRIILKNSPRSKVRLLRRRKKTKRRKR